MPIIPYYAYYSRFHTMPTIPYYAYNMPSIPYYAYLEQMRTASLNSEFTGSYK